MNQVGDDTGHVWSRGRDALTSGQEPSSAGPRVSGGWVATNARFGIGNVLGTGFRVWFRNIIPFLLITAILYAPVWIGGMLLLHSATAAQDPDRASLALGSVTLLAFPLNVLLSAALTYGVVMDLQGRRASIGACISTGFRRFLPAVGVGVLTALCCGLAALCLIIPGVIVACMLYVAMPASVLDRSGVFGALGRSAELTRGHKLGIFGLMIVLGLVQCGIYMVITMVLLFPIASGEGRLSPDELFSRVMYLQLISSMISGSISAVMASVAYYFLRAEKEGISAADLATIFD